MIAYVLRRDLLQNNDLDKFYHMTSQEIEHEQCRQLDYLLETIGEEDNYIGIYSPEEVEDLINLHEVDDGFKPYLYYIKIYPEGIE